MIIKYSKSLQEARERNEAMQENKEKGNNGFFVPGDLPVDNRKDIDVKNCTMDDIQNYLVSKKGYTLADRQPAVKLMRIA